MLVAASKENVKLMMIARMALCSPGDIIWFGGAFPYLVVCNSSSVLSCLEPDSFLK